MISAVICIVWHLCNLLCVCAFFGLIFNARYVFMFYAELSRTMAYTTRKTVNTLVPEVFLDYSLFLIFSAWESRKRAWESREVACEQAHVGAQVRAKSSGEAARWIACEQAPGEPRSLCSPNSSVSRLPKFFPVPAGSLACSQATRGYVCNI